MTYVPNFTYTHYAQMQMSKFTSTNKSCICKITPRFLYPSFDITHTAGYVEKLTQLTEKVQNIWKIWYYNSDDY